MSGGRGQACAEGGGKHEWREGASMSRGRGRA